YLLLHLLIFRAMHGPHPCLPSTGEAEKASAKQERNPVGSNPFKAHLMYFMQACKHFVNNLVCDRLPIHFVIWCERFSQPKKV
ncbi:hypothetical protein, partial [Comamonas kerstersii]|uniref:hypothetical protein n=1 Tax=Comamonas kerstersii TaxID=225992 RepID=UPI0026705F7D